MGQGVAGCKCKEWDLSFDECDRFCNGYDAGSDPCTGFAYNAEEGECGTAYPNPNHATLTDALTLTPTPTLTLITLGLTLTVARQMCNLHDGAV
jgi:hypothetical protein